MKKRIFILLAILFLVVITGMFEYQKKREIVRLSKVIQYFTEYREQHQKWPSESEIEAKFEIAAYRESESGVTIRYSYGLFGEYSMFVRGKKNGMIQTGTY